MSMYDDIGFDESDVELARRLVADGIVSGDDFDDDDFGDMIAGIDIVGEDLDDEDIEDIIAGVEDELMEDDDDGVAGVDIVGLGRRRRRPRRLSRSKFSRFLGSRKGKSRLKRVVARAARRKAKTTMPRVRTTTPEDVKTRLLPFFRDANNVGLIPGGAEVDIVAEPQMPFRPTALVIGDESARDFVITDIKIGTQTLFAATGAVPASAFKADGVLQQLMTMTGQTSQQITIRVRNISADQRPFYGQMIGHGAE